MTKFTKAVGLWLAAFLLVIVCCTPAYARNYTFVDAHLHYVDFFQHSDGVESLLDAMDHTHVEHAQLMGIGVAKKWDAHAPKKPRFFMSDDAPVYWYSATDYLLAEALTRAPDNVQARFSPFISGFNPTDLNAAEHIQRLIDLYPGFWKGIGEIFTRHDDLTRLTEGEVPRADHPALMAVYRLAAERKLPVLVHSNITAKRENRPLYLDEFEQAVKANPDTVFLWAHAGTSEELNRRLGRLSFLRDEVERMLKAYPNLYIDLSWTVLEPYLLDASGHPRQEWVRLIQRYPDRFTLGSDLVGQFYPMKQVLNRFIPFLDALDERTANKVARDNFMALMGIE
ncbi:amidohydrolase family protein [Phytohalomonas tamaricis]|uniref:amidohydrolase family protein n=1 Tax=Phytohalomonas tamaricis TaxID=2081032 RepID=UPI000D0ADA15|nr:amidohydrolase family protein [Phytohalomonas tamaricis]